MLWDGSGHGYGRSLHWSFREGRLIREGLTAT